MAADARPQSDSNAAAASATECSLDVPRHDLSPRQQLEALQKAREQAEHRVRLGMQLFKAAESRLNSEESLVERAREERKQFRQQMEHTVNSKLTESNDHLHAELEEIRAQLAVRMQQHTEKMLELHEQQDRMRCQIEKLQHRCQEVEQQTRALREQADARQTPQPAAAKPVTPPTTSAAAASSGDSPNATKSQPPIHPKADPTSEPEPDAAPEEQSVFSRVIDQLRQSEQARPSEAA